MGKKKELSEVKQRRMMSILITICNFYYSRRNFISFPRFLIFTFHVTGRLKKEGGGGGGDETLVVS